ncbi:hypothetical protein Nepgr_011613 [Nepenthes gracilis]|uniref:Uncharacterized protein n=1 Tax=Nepenthes gracilis TaxID=150966 RepID=A0AAD3SEQ9_NEPGR|nr:hypothetical protein Nepgr_011613 [Nepenthes gracilis]
MLKDRGLCRLEMAVTFKVIRSSLIRPRYLQWWREFYIWAENMGGGCPAEDILSSLKIEGIDYVRLDMIEDYAIEIVVVVMADVAHESATRTKYAAVSVDVNQHPPSPANHFNSLPIP